jgi:hypothetical protein
MLLEYFNLVHLHQAGFCDKINTFVSVKSEMARRLTSSSQPITTLAIGFGIKARTILGLVFPVSDKIKGYFGK